MTYDFIHNTYTILYAKYVDETETEIDDYIFVKDKDTLLDQQIIQDLNLVDKAYYESDFFDND